MRRRRRHPGIARGPGSRTLPAGTSRAAALLGVWLGVGGLLFAAPAAAQTFDERFLEGLRQRRLFGLAEKFCADRLARSDLGDAQRIEASVELSRTLVEHALHSPPRDREPLWQQAAAALQAFLDQQPPSPRRVLVEVQLGLVYLARGEQLRQEAEVKGDDAGRVEEARQWLRLAVASLEAAARDTAEQLRQRHLGQAARPGQLTAAELAPLARNLSFQRARAFRSQGQCYPPGSPDRLNALEQAAALLKPLAESDGGDPLMWPSRLNEIACYRLLGDEAAAQRRLASLAEAGPPPEVALAGRAERVRLALARQAIDEAVRLLDEGLVLDGVSSAELDYAALEAFLAASGRAAAEGRADEASQWRAKGGELVALIHQRHGPYWSRRAETLLAGSVLDSPATAAIGELIKAGESYYRAGRDAEALAAYDRAWKQAVDSGQPQAGFDAAFTAAAIEQSRGRPAAAATRFRQLALAAADHPRAGEAHLLAIFNTAQTLGAASPEAVAVYRDLLLEHLKTWSKATDRTTDQARLWLGRLEERQGRWDEALTLYQAIARDGPLAGEAAEAIGRCHLAALAELRAGGQPTAERGAAAARHFENVITGGAGALPQTWTAAHRDAALAAAGIWLDFAGNAARSETILAAALAGATDAPPEWTRQAQSMRICALAAQGRREEAAGLLAQLSEGNPRHLLALVQGLGRIAEAGPEPTRRSLATLVLQAAGGLRDPAVEQALTPDERRSVGVLVAQSLAAAGQIREARQSFSKLAAEWPKDAVIQEHYAALLEQADDAPSWHEALERWRLLEQGSAAGSPRWFRAKLALATIHARLGNKDRALQIVRLTQVLHPDLGGAEMKNRFLALRDSLEAP